MWITTGAGEAKNRALSAAMVYPLDKPIRRTIPASIGMADDAISLAGTSHSGLPARGTVDDVLRIVVMIDQPATGRHGETHHHRW